MDTPDDRAPLPPGAVCDHANMRECANEPPCGEACGHFWCPDCDLFWDEGAEGPWDMPEDCASDWEV